MASRKQLLAEMQKHGATMEEFHNESGRNIVVDAPCGKEWISSGTTVLSGPHKAGWPISEVYDDLIERMKGGLSDAEPEG